MNLPFRTFCSAAMICLLIVSMANLRPANGQQETPFEIDAPLSPAGKVISDSTPTTPSELIQAIDQLVTLGDRDLANFYARELGKKLQQASRESLLAVGDSLGPQPLFRIANNSELDETARSFCQNILAAMRQRDMDPQRLQRLAKLAVGNDLQTRRDALLKLRVAGPTATNALVRILLKGSPNEQEAARKGLLFLGTSVVDPLLAVLETENVDLRRQVLAILRQRADPAALDDIRIAAIASASMDAKKDLARKIRRSIGDYLQGKKDPGDSAGVEQTLWKWDDDRATLTKHPGKPSLLAAKNAYRLARALSRVSPTEKNMALETLTLLQYEKLNTGLHLPLDHNRMLQRKFLTDQQKQNLKNLDFLETVFQTALRDNYVPAIIGTAELLEQTDVASLQGTNLVTRRGVEVHPLVSAMQHKDRRVRLAACKAIVALAGDFPYAGTSIVSDTLRYLAASQGTPRILVADRNESRRQFLASMLKGAGYVPDVYSSGRAAMMAAQQKPDYVAMFIAFTIGPRTIEDILHEFRTDPQTAGLPIGILVDSRNEHRAQRLIANDPLSTLFFMPNTEALAASDVKKLILLTGDDFVSKEERLAQSSTALALFKTIIEQSPDSYNPDRWVRTLKESIQQADQASLAADILALMEVSAAQVTLADTVANAYLPFATRQRAAKAFAKNIASHGIGLSKLEIQQQKDRYDATKGEGTEEESLQWSILEAINQAAGKGSN